jgi:hypothetical protein
VSCDLVPESIFSIALPFASLFIRVSACDVVNIAKENQKKAKLKVPNSPSNSFALAPILLAGSPSTNLSESAFHESNKATILFSRSGAFANLFISIILFPFLSFNTSLK